MPHIYQRRHLIAAVIGLMGASAGAAEPALNIGDLYGDVTGAGVQLTPSARALVGRRITVIGYMAPPLKAESDFFVLTSYPMSNCPFCSNAADWPVDILAVTLGSAAEMLSPSYRIEVSGVLEFGPKVDRETGFVSLVRLTDASWRRVS